MDALTGNSGRLMPRDYAMLRDIGEHGFSSARWLKGYFSTEKPNRNHYRRLSILRRLGLIEDLIGDGGHLLGYRLTKKGTALLCSLGGATEATSRYRASYRTTFNHDDDLVGLAQVFRSFPRITDYRTEHSVRAGLALKHGYQERKTEGYKVPDALFTVDTKQRRLRIAVELEIAAKAEAYYRRILRQLSVSTDFDIVFILVASAKVQQRIMRVLEWVRANDPTVRFAKRKNGFYLAQVHEVLKEKGNAKFRGDGTEFTLAELAS